MTTFKELGLSEALLLGLADLGFEMPTPIQQQVIPVALKSTSDIVALAQTGTGKTAAFGLPLLQRLQLGQKHVQAVVLCPTRELCLQVADDLTKYGRFAPSCKIAPVYGGAPIEAQIRQLRAGIHVVIATPGRLIDLLVRQALNLDKVSLVVLDEADEMLHLGFRDAVNLILEATENRHSLWLFSATMPEEVRTIARTYMRNPIEISLIAHQQINADIEHEYYLCRPEHRYDALKRIVDAHPGIYGLIFCRTRMEAKEVAERMIRDGYSADALHGDLLQSDRDRIMQRFREGHLQLLVATDVAARGIDVSDLSHVIHYSLPDEPESYLHRAGRTGRAGRKGVSISILSPKMEERLRLIERRIRIAFTQKAIPSGAQVCERQLMYIIQSIRQQEVQREQIAPFLPQIYEALHELSKEELIERFASVEFNRFLAYYRNAPDINLNTRFRRSENANRAELTHKDKRLKASQRLSINIGQRDGLYKSVLLDLLTHELCIPKHAVGKIEIKHNHTLIEVSSRFAHKVCRGLDNFKVQGRRIRVESEYPLNGRKAAVKKGRERTSKAAAIL